MMIRIITIFIKINFQEMNSNNVRWNKMKKKKYSTSCFTLHIDLMLLLYTMKKEFQVPTVYWWISNLSSLRSYQISLYTKWRNYMHNFALFSFISRINSHFKLSEYFWDTTTSYIKGERRERIAAEIASVVWMYSINYDEKKYQPEIMHNLTARPGSK